MARYTLTVGGCPLEIDTGNKDVQLLDGNLHAGNKSMMGSNISGAGGHPLPSKR
jgi:hypothetical protein